MQDLTPKGPPRLFITLIKRVRILAGLDFIGDTSEQYYEK
jgi:hypothetical protein